MSASAKPSKIVLETAIHQHLNASYPKVGAVFTPRSMDSSAAKKFYGGKSLSEYFGAAAVDSDSDDEPVRKPVVAAKSSPKAAPKKAAVDSDSDDEPVRKPVVAAKSSPKAAPKSGARPIPESSEDDEPAKPQKKAPSSSPALKPKSAPTGARRAIPDSDSDDDNAATTAQITSAFAKPKRSRSRNNGVAEEEEGPAAKKERKEKKEKKEKKAKKAVVHSDSEEDPSQPKQTAAEVFAAYRKKKAEEAAAEPQEEKSTIAWSHTPGTRFQRVDPSKITYHNDALKDNSAIELASNFRQNQEMMRVRGKEFNKHKQKNKSKLYAAGVEMGIKSYKFDDD